MSSLLGTGVKAPGSGTPLAPRPFQGALGQSGKRTADRRDRYSHIPIESAISVLTGTVVVADMQSSGRITLRDMILARVRESSGTTSSKVAAELTEGGRQTGETTVSSIFSRLKGEGLIERRDGLWFAKNEKASDALTPEAFDDMGPESGRGTGYPPTPPEGSIPSGSTHVTKHPVAFDDDLNDDVPF